MTGPLLALELSGPRSGVALRLEDGTVHEREFGGERGRALLAEVDAVVGGAGLLPADLSAVVVGTGPGSYTGLRIACAAARTLAYSLGLRAGGLCSFEVAALAAPAGREVHLLLDAYRREVYHASFARTGDEVEVRVAPRVVPRDAAGDAVPQGALLLGDPALLGAARADVELLAPEVAPRARDLAALAAQRGADAWGVPEPLYLRAAR